MRQARSNQETNAGKHALPCLTQKAPWKGPSAESGEKHEPASDIDAAVDGLKALDPTRPIREADISACLCNVRFTAGHRGCPIPGNRAPLFQCIGRRFLPASVPV